MRRALLLLLAALLAAGCVPAGQQRIVITIRHSRFEPAAVTVPRGRPVEVVIRNADPIDHEWIVGDEATHERHRTGTEPVHASRPTEVSVEALGERTTTVSFDRAGTLRFICHLPGHEAYGMVGTLTVSP